MTVAYRKLPDQQYAALLAQLSCDPDFAFWPQTLAAQLETLTFSKPHGKRQQWLDTLTTLPALLASDVDFTAGRVRIGQPADCSEAERTQLRQCLQTSEAERTQLRQCLQTFIPWRKGPFELFGIYIDSEWRSDWKWQRVAPHLSDLCCTGDWH